ncbi:MAG TPA: HEPN domain-containing protein [Thermomicrobiales bacterium]|nr:HEPN domain-containing protein [Thermomicrobiales bacterium]
MKPETEAWISVAEVDIRTAHRLVAPPDPIPESACYHAQQCIEKYLKATLEEAGRPVPRTHDLGRLLLLTDDLLPELASAWPAIEEIMPYVVTLRYPHDPMELGDMTEEAEQAVATMTSARSVVRAALGMTGDMSPREGHICGEPENSIHEDS